MLSFAGSLDYSTIVKRSNIHGETIVEVVLHAGADLSAI